MEEGYQVMLRNQVLIDIQEMNNISLDYVTDFHSS